MTVFADGHVEPSPIKVRLEPLESANRPEANGPRITMWSGGL
jgi:hypothetical protein